MCSYSSSSSNTQSQFASKHSGVCPLSGNGFKISQLEDDAFCSWMMALEALLTKLLTSLANSIFLLMLTHHSIIQHRTLIRERSGKRLISLLVMIRNHNQTCRQKSSISYGELERRGTDWHTRKQLKSESAHVTEIARAISSSSKTQLNAKSFFIWFPIASVLSSPFLLGSSNPFWWLIVHSLSDIWSSLPLPPTHQHCSNCKHFSLNNTHSPFPWSARRLPENRPPVGHLCSGGHRRQRRLRHGASHYGKLWKANSKNLFY